MRDVVVVGSGHNALVAACYLAREGLDVEVVERDTVLGGAVSTVERWPGYAVDRGSSAHIMIRHTGIVEDLRLAECGLRYLDMDPWGFAPFGPPDEQQALTFFVDLDAHLRVHRGRLRRPRRRRLPRVRHRLGRPQRGGLRGLPGRADRRPARAATCAGRVGKRAGVGGLEMSRQFLQPGDQLLDEHFTDERLKTALSWLGAQSGPPSHEVATADLVGWNPIMHLVPPGRAVGGSGALTSGARGTAAPARRHAAPGRRRRRDHPRRGRRRRPAVRTAGGEHIATRAVLAGCHVLTTFELLGDAALLARVRTRRSASATAWAWSCGWAPPTCPATRVPRRDREAVAVVRPRRGSSLAPQPRPSRTALRARTASSSPERRPPTPRCCS